MENFIVWYSDENNKNKFSEEFTLDELISQNHLNIISNSPLLRNFKIDNINRGVGLKDTEGNEIYVDCSIVKFIYKDLKTEENTKLYGYFTWNDEDLRYEIDILNPSLYVCLNYKVSLYIQIKIIDTLQENKLGLIKIKNTKGEN